MEESKAQARLSKQQFEESLHISENIEKNQRNSQLKISSVKQASGREISLCNETNQIPEQQLKDQKAESNLFWFIEFQEPDWLYLSDTENQYNQIQKQPNSDESNESLDIFIQENKSRKTARKNSKKFK